MKKHLYLPLLAALPLFAGETLFEDGFEDGLGNWNQPNFMRQSSERAATGRFSLEFTGTGTAVSKPIAVKPESRYRVSLSSYSTARSGFVLIAEPCDAKMKSLSIPGSYSTSEGLWDANREKQKRNYWMPLYTDVDTGKDAAYLRIKISRQGAKTTKVWIDDVVVEELESRPELRPDADAPALLLPGPDGILYPDFTRAGLSKPWNPPAKVFKVEDFGAKADDGKDDSDAIDRAVEAAAKVKGGVIAFGPGTYRLSRKVSIRHDNIVFRGAGPDKTRLELGLPDNNVGLFTSGSDNRLSPRATIRIYFPKEGAKQVSVRPGKLGPAVIPAASFEELPDKPDFAVAVFAVEPFFDQLEAGPLPVSAEVEYAGGRAEKSTAPFVVDASHRPDVYASSYLTFIGRDLPPHEVPFTSGLKRGESSFTIESTEGIRPGDLVEINLPITPRWDPVNNFVPWWKGIDFRAEVAAVDGRRITLVQPVRFDFPLEDKPFLKKLDPVKGSGIENMTLSQVGDIQIELKMRTVSFGNAFNCRAANLVIDRPGTSGIYGSRLKNCEFTDCRMTRPWRTKFGGLAYTGWDRSFDCLIANVETDSMRHAPLFNWSCSGNVVTGSTFHESDAQWHTGWCHDNLIENSTIITTTNQFNSYGWAFFAVPTADAEHGGIGPRNVVYNCDATSFRGGLHMGGYNGEWIIAYNKIYTTKGPGVLERLGAYQNRFIGNVFVLDDPSSPAFYLESLDNRSDIIRDNTLYGGNGVLVAGPAVPAENRGNQALPRRESKLVPRPQAPVPSIYHYQKEQRKGK